GMRDWSVTGVQTCALPIFDIEPEPYPGLATDLQPPTSVLLTQARGTSRVHEAIFEDRLEWLTGLQAMGASIDITDTHHAAIHGRSEERRVGKEGRWRREAY